ncbi:MAG TPA: DNA polymerase III subunit delta' [bacterium]|nr:DNA polymerase III subunit delta' [bacterium]
MSRRWLRESKRRSASQPEAEAAPAAMPSRLTVPVGQGEAFGRWVRAARRGDLPHGVVIEGAPGSGKTTVLTYLAAALLCPSDLDPDAPCGMCNVCTRIANELHPDVQVVRRPRDESEFVRKETSFHRITVHQVKAVQDQLAHHAVEGGARVAAFVEASRIEEDGQNMLLKTLEEPGEATFLLLETSRPEQLLPTVRSRVQRLRVLPLSDEALRGELERRIPQHFARFDEIVALAGGSLGQALLAGTERVVQLHDLVRQWLATPHGLRPFATAQTVLKGLQEKREEVDAARLFLWVLRRELRQRRDALASSAGDSYPAGSLEPWTTWLERTLQAERDLDLQIPPEQVLTACLVQLVA